MLYFLFYVIFYLCFFLSFFSIRPMPSHTSMLRTFLYNIFSYWRALSEKALYNCRCILLFIGMMTKGFFRGFIESKIS